MSNPVLDRVVELADLLEQDGPVSEELGRVSDPVAAALREAGVIRMLQPQDFGGHEAHPTDFMRTCYEIGQHHGAAGWIAGVVGVHPHELAQGTRQLQEELWAEDPDTWIASPYAPIGRARPVEGGYIFNGRWPFSSGTDHCQWVMIGGLITDQEGNVADREPIHFVLPRSDYTIDHDSWDVMGLRGTGSKDIVVKDAFVPEHRLIRTNPVTDGSAELPEVRDIPLYRMPRNVVFSGAITTATIALAQGTLASYVAWTRQRSSRFGSASTDPFQLSELGPAAADIDASIGHVLHDMDRAFDIVSSGRLLTLSERAEIRRNQVAASHRAAEAADRIFKVSGGSQLHAKNPMQRMWRDCQSALHHVQNYAGPLFQAYGMDHFGGQMPAAVKV
ncbi:hydroxylase [Nocardioides marmotae]|uniref:Hydroxylase n=1 Tax=Nocardioides marmotae TaxID=2663857 RepID=A0A6I3JA65_9ACTN|nr:hydroxylase [Nocardioides marmotae]MCR6029925.1 hydroxylase [Gordonia jinghuaiqii]MBC9732881.1 hydroxylase [Nocardioides marmotae]MTB83995.1 hydroxylase [Nocardioides marmotae]MTB93555.1 hydroxylase [Nocardioides marmotae]QKD99925.1 hydroxylase [Nocardioides marmotae]